MTDIALYEPGRHLPPVVTEWRDEAVRETIRQLAADVICARQADGLWPGAEAGFARSVYEGAAGIAWALAQLAARGYIDDPAPRGLAPFTPAVAEPELESGSTLFREFGVPVSHSFLLGSTGTQMQLFMETADRTLLDGLDRLIGENLTHPWMENLWGAPGTMLAAWHLYRITGEERFARHLRLGAAYLWDRLEYCSEARCRLWNIALYGERSFLLGAGHGFVGNAFPILKAGALLGDQQNAAWQQCIRETVCATAQWRGELVNWKQSVGQPRRGRDAPLVQQCHGAPGFVIALAPLIGSGDARFDRVLAAAAELIWRAGPLDKYPGLCHGTPGNGYALLKLLDRTGEELWLQRARCFALSAVARRETLLRAGRQPRYSLWDGDMGLALFLADCLEVRPEFPTLDYF